MEEVSNSSSTNSNFSSKLSIISIVSTYKVTSAVNSDTDHTAKID